MRFIPNPAPISVSEDLPSPPFEIKYKAPRRKKVNLFPPEMRKKALSKPRFNSNMNLKKKNKVVAAVSNESSSSSSFIPTIDSKNRKDNDESSSSSISSYVRKLLKDAKVKTKKSINEERKLEKNTLVMKKNSNNVKVEVEKENYAVKSILKITGKNMKNKMKKNVRFAVGTKQSYKLKPEIEIEKPEIFKKIKKNKQNKKTYNEHPNKKEELVLPSNEILNLVMKPRRKYRVSSLKKKRISVKRNSENLATYGNETMQSRQFEAEIKLKSFLKSKRSFRKKMK